MKRTERIAKRQAHAQAYKQGWDDCEAFYARLLAQMKESGDSGNGDDVCNSVAPDVLLGVEGRG